MLIPASASQLRRRPKAGDAVGGDVGAREFVETLKIISDVGVDDVADLVRELDTDGDGQISKEEFKALLIKHSQFLDADFRN